MADLTSMADLIAVQAERFRGQVAGDPEKVARTAEIREIVLLHVQGAITDAEFDAQVGPREFAEARFLWGIGSELWNLTQPMVERRTTMREMLRGYQD